MELLKLCDGDTAALLELSSSEKELADLFSNISRLSEILSTVKTNIFQPLESVERMKTEIDASVYDTTVVLNHFRANQNNVNIPSSETIFQSRCLLRSLNHFIDNCSKTEAMISELNYKQLCSLLSLFASKQETHIIPVISDSFVKILKIIVNTYLIIANLDQTSVLIEEKIWTGRAYTYFYENFVETMRQIRDAQNYFFTLVSLDEIMTRANVSSHQEITPTQKLTLKVNSNKKLSVIHGDLCNSSEEYDLVVCSAYKNAYAPSRGTLINGLLYNKNISVYLLSKDREINLSDRGAWLSRETNTAFHRIACVELLDYQNRDKAEIVNYKSVFSTLYYILV